MLIFEVKRRSIKSFVLDHRGTAAIEFGLLGVVCLLLILETMQAGLFFCCSVFLERAVDRSTRAIQTGTVATQGLSASQFRIQVVCPALPLGMPCSNIVVDVRNASVGTSPAGYYNFVNGNQSGLQALQMDNTSTSFCPGNQGTHVVLQVFYAMPTFSPFWLALSSVSWNGFKVHFIDQTAAFKNEPFGPSDAASC